VLHYRIIRHIFDLSSRTLLLHVSEQPGCSWRIVIPNQSAMMLLA